MNEKYCFESYEEHPWLDFNKQIVERINLQEKKKSDGFDIWKNSKCVFFESTRKESYFNKLPVEINKHICSFTGKNGVLNGEESEKLINDCFKGVG